MMNREYTNFVKQLESKMEAYKKGEKTFKEVDSWAMNELQILLEEQKATIDEINNCFHYMQENADLSDGTMTKERFYNTWNKIRESGEKADAYDNITLDGVGTARTEDGGYTRVLIVGGKTYYINYEGRISIL